MSRPMFTRTVAAALAITLAAMGCSAPGNENDGTLSQRQGIGSAAGAVPNQSGGGDPDDGSGSGDGSETASPAYRQAAAGVPSRTLSGPPNITKLSMTPPQMGRIPSVQDDAIVPFYGFEDAALMFVGAGLGRLVGWSYRSLVGAASLRSRSFWLEGPAGVKVLAIAERRGVRTSVTDGLQIEGLHLAEDLTYREGVGLIAKGQREVIAGAGHAKPIDDLNRLVAEYGLDARTVSKVKATTNTHQVSISNSLGTKTTYSMNVHAYVGRVARTGREIVVDPKVKTDVSVKYCSGCSPPK